MKNSSNNVSRSRKVRPPATAQTTVALSKNSGNDRTESAVGQQLGNTARDQIPGYPQAANSSQPRDIQWDSTHAQTPTSVHPTTAGQLQVSRSPQAVQYQQAPPFPAAPNSAKVMGYAPHPGYPQPVEYLQAAGPPEAYAYPQPASYPGPSGYLQAYPQGQNDTAALGYQPLPAYAPIPCQTYTQGLPPDMDPSNRMYYDAANNGIFPQTPRSTGIYYTEPPPNANAPWQAEQALWTQGNQELGPQLGDTHEHIEPEFASDPLSWASHEALSTCQCQHEPLSHFEEPQFESYVTQITEECTRPVCQQATLVPRGFDVTCSLSPPGSWVSYSFPTSHEPAPPPAPPTNVNVHSAVSLSGTRDGSSVPQQPSNDMLCRVSSYIDDKGLGTTEQPMPVTAATTRTVATEVQFRFASPRADRRSVSVMTSFTSVKDGKTTGDTHYETAVSHQVTASSREQGGLRSPQLASEAKDKEPKSEFSSSEHGWYQPLHIQSQGSSSTDERGAAEAALKFLDFTWGAPEHGTKKGSYTARATSGTGDKVGKFDAFSWSSKGVLKNRDPTTTQQFKPTVEAAKEEETPSRSSPHGESSRASDSNLASPAVFSTNLLHSVTSDNELGRNEVASPDGSPDFHETTSPTSKPAAKEKAGIYHFDTQEEEETETETETEEKHEDKEEGDHEDNEDNDEEAEEENQNGKTEEKENGSSHGDDEETHEEYKEAAEGIQIEKGKKKKKETREEDKEAAEDVQIEKGKKKKKERKQRKVAAVVPVAVAMPTEKKSSNKQKHVDGRKTSAEQAEKKLNSETGISDATSPKDVVSASKVKSPYDKLPPSRAEPEAAPSASVVSPPSPTGLTHEQEEEADKASEEMDKDLRDLELTTVELYPESRLVILLAILCLIWIIFLVLSAAVKHGLTPTTDGDTTTVTMHSYSQPTRDPTWWHPVTQTTASMNFTSKTPEPLRGNFICSSDYCQREGNRLRALTAHSTKEPCENFYEHVCGAWKNAASRMIQNLPGAAVSTDTLLQASMEAQLLAYIRDNTHADVTPARVLYGMCMNRGAADATLSDVKNLLRLWGSDWPQRDSTNRSPTDVWHFAAKLMQVLGVPSLVGIEIGLDPWNLELNIIELGPPRTVFFSRDVSEPRVMTLFEDATRAAAEALKPSDAGAASAAAKDVSIALASISLHKLDDLGTSPLDFQVNTFSSLGRGVQYFLRTVFANVVTLDSRTRLLVHRGPLVRRELDETVDNLPPRVMLNYLGLLALVALSPFLPEQLSSLRILHSVHTLGRAETGSNDLLCLRAVSQAYPACLATASRALYKNTHRSVWLSQLESLFVGKVRDVVWLDNLTSLFVRYKMQHHRLARFFPVWPLGDCNATTKAASSKAVHAFVDAVTLRQKQELQQLVSPPLQPSTGSPLSVWPRYRLCLQLFQIPVGLVNASVPANGTLFALHLSRLAVRLYAALAQLLYEGTVYEREIPLYFTEEAERTLEDLLDCLVCDARRRFPHGLRAERVRNALLEQVLALQLGFLAFRRLLAVRRIWSFDFRLSTLPEVSSDQLFFLYYALDHCELSDTVFESHQFEAYRRLPAAVRVNMAVRQSTRFAQAFHCPPGSPMVAGEQCQVLR